MGTSKSFSGRDSFPPFLRDLIASPPRAGEGVHGWLFKVSRQLHAHLPAGEIISLLEKVVSNCGRPVLRSEVVSAVQSALPCAWQPRINVAPAPHIPKWPKTNAENRTAIIIRIGGGLADLWELSTPRIEDDTQHTEAIIDAFFPGNPLLCCGRSQTEFDTQERDAWRGQLARLPFIVPSPMSAITGQTKNGKESKHALANTGTRRFLICEFDHGTTDDQAALLLHLGAFAPLVCVVHSGGKSLHGWFFVHCQPETKIEKFFRYAVSVGADKATWTRSQFVRMPDGTRDNDLRQTVFFLNFKPFGN
jgi:hypothetical protein